MRFPVTADRLDGIRDGLEDAGLAWYDVPVPGRARRPDARAAARELGADLLDRPHGPPGSCAMSDEVAAGRARRRNRRGMARCPATCRSWASTTP